MLQPQQLREVSAQYAHGIAEVRDFLRKAGIPVETPEALGEVANRLAHDRGFHRDLTSNIWVALDRFNGQISYSDLLGTVALAAAGPLYASTASEDAAHDLLRFLMEARHSLEVFAKPASADKPARTSSVSPVPPAQTAAAAPASVPTPRQPQPFPTPARAGAPVQQAIPARRVSSLSAALAAATDGIDLESRPAAVPVPALHPVAASFASEAPTPVFAADPEPVTFEQAMAELAPAPVLRPPTPEPYQAPRPARVQLPEPPTSLGLAEGGDQRRSRVAWIGAILCILALALGAWRLHTTTARPENAPAPVVDGDITASPPSSSATEPSPALGAPVPESSPVASQQGLPRNLQRQTTPSSRQESARLALPSAGDSNRPATPSPWLPTVKPSAAKPYPTAPDHGNAPSYAAASSAPSFAGSPSPNIASPGAPIIRSAARPSFPAIVPAATLSKRLDSPTVPADSVAQNQLTADGRRYPRLLRRKPGAQLTDDDSGELVASVRPASASAPGTVRAGRPANPQPQGIVRPTALGMMAGNVLYSPAPVYPQAASAAHVQGQVKIQAQVDRDGNVAWARVVSGPPLLRDAALDAVQHWRYKPYLAGGKPAPASASAVLDFELP